MPAHLIADDGPLRGLVLNFEEGNDWIIGRDPDVADYVIEDSTVSRKHARVTKSSQGIFIQNLSRVNPTLVNGENRGDERVLLHAGDRVQIGNHLFTFQETASKKKEAKRAAYDDIFGELEEPPPPPREEEPEERFEPEEAKVETRAEEKAPEREETAYDTIFEDLEDVGEIPFNLLQPATLLLKVVAGPNAGAEIGIEKGRSYVIGKDPNSSDIVFQDLSVSRNHARLSVGAEGKIEIEDLGSKNGTVVDGVPISEKRMVTPQDIIALGTTVFLIIDREAPQETIYSSPMIPTFEPAKSSVAGEIALSEEEEREVSGADWKKVPIPRRHLAVAAAFLFVFLTVFLSFFSLFKPERIEVVQKEPVDKIKEAVAKFNDVQFSFNPASGKLFLTGHVVTAVDYQELQYNISQIAFVQSVETTVVIDELVWKMMNDILGDNPDWRSVSIHSPKAGQFVANGYVQTPAQMVALNEYLTVNFPYLDRLQNKVAVEELLEVEVQNILVVRGFGGITFNLNGGDLLLSGRYDESRKNEYEDAIKTLNALTGISRVRDVAIASTPSTSAIDISQQFQVGGSALYDGQGYSVVLNGAIYTAGQTVDGMKITSIGQKTILLEKDGMKYTIEYGR